MTPYLISKVCFDDAEVVHGVDRALRDGRLHGVGRERNEVDARESCGEGWGVARRCRSVLVLRTHIEREPPRLAAGAEACNRIEALLVGPGVVAGDRLSQVEAIAK